MTKHFGRLAAVALMLSAAIPFSAGAQTPAEVEAARKRAAPPAAARPAAPPPAARPAPPPAAARPAPPPAAARPAPPPPAARVAPQRPQPPAARIERPQRREAPPAARIAPPSQNPAARVAPQRQDRPDRRRDVERPRRPDAPAINRAERNRPSAPAAAAPNAAQRTAPAATPASPQQARQQQRQERLLQQREDRALRSLPPRQRVERRQEIQRARQERATQRQQAIQPAARTGIAAQPDAASRSAPNARVNPRAAARLERGPRRNGQARVTEQAARQGRFAAGFAASPQRANARAARAIARAAHIAPRRAWQSGRRASFVAWYGPVFYPYAYSDVFSYAFWPDGYDDDYWYVAYDDFFDGVFFGEVGQPEYVGSIEGAPPRAASAPTYKAVQDVCKQPGNGITAWPTAEIESKVGLNADQKQLLGDVKNAGARAASVFSATCPSENAFPLTPTGRLASMTARLDATLEAVQTVRPALEAFYASLNDEQKERFNAIGPAKTAASSEARDALPDDARKCGEAKPGLTNLPIEQIDDALKPNEAQQAELDRLAEATVKAVGILQNACPAETPLTPPGRLQAIETRLQAMAEAARTVKPPLDSFYASLNAEQKARFNRLGRDLAQTSASSNQ